MTSRFWKNLVCFPREAPPPPYTDVGPEEPNKIVQKKLEDMEARLRELETPKLKNVVVLPFADTIEGYSGCRFKLISQHLQVGQHVQKGDRFTISGEGRRVEFRVVEIVPKGLEHGIIGKNTLVHYEGTPLQRADDNMD